MKQMPFSRVARKHITVAALVALALYANTFAQGPPATLVVTDIVRKMEFHDQISLVGRTEANAHSSVVATVSGRVRAIDATEGRWVKKGDALVTIDDEKIRPLCAAKQAQAADAKAQAEVAERDLARAEKLYLEKTVSDARIEQIRAETIGAVENNKRLQAESEALEVDLRNCVVRAPFDGYTVRKQIDIGEWVDPGVPVFEMVDIASIKVTLDLPERYFGQVALGSAVYLTIGGDERAVIRGTVTGVSPSATSQTHTFPIIVKVDTHDQRLGHGMLIKAIVTLKESSVQMAVSKDAIVRQGAMTMVYTITDGNAAPIQVTLGSVSESMVAISGEGVTEGMSVVVRGNERIFPGAPVRTEQPTGSPKVEKTTPTAPSKKK